MGYMESATLSCMATETVKDRVLANLDIRPESPNHPLDTLAKSPPRYALEYNTTPNKAHENKWDRLSPQAQATALTHTKFYLEKLIKVVQGDKTERSQMTRHLIKAIGSIL